VKRLVLLAPALLAVVALVLALRPGAKATASTRADAASGSPRQSTAQSTDDAVPGETDAAREERIARIVAARNLEQQENTKRFVADGWEMVANPAPPDERLLAFDPSLVKAGREVELADQIASTVPKVEHVENLATLARTARDERTRVVAVEALGRIRDAEAQAALVDLLGKLDPTDTARREIGPLLRPTSLEDPYALRLAQLLDAPGLTDAERSQIAFTLALIGLRDGSSLSGVSPAAAALIEDMTALALDVTRGRIPGVHTPHDLQVGGSP
jgi:hypothetical protein